MAVDNLRLSEDYMRVSQKELSQRPVEDKILNFSATTQEIEDWCFSQDPLMETISLDTLKRGNEDSSSQLDSELNRRHLVYKFGAFSLLVHFFNDEVEGLSPSERSDYIKEYLRLHTRPDEDKFRQKNREFLREHELMIPSSSSISDEEYSLLSPMRRMTNFFIENIAGLDPLDIKLDEMDVQKKIMLAADMLKKAGFFGDDSPWVENSLYGSRTECSHQSSEIYSVISDIVLPSDDLDLKLLGAQAKWALTAVKLSRSGFIMNTLDKGRYKVMDEAPVLDMIRTFRDITKDLSNKELGKIRGRLHELMWLMDFGVLLMDDDPDSLDIYIEPAVESEDAPRIDHPKNRRGFDYAITNLRKGTHFKFQLKSKKNPHYEKMYHPMVTQLKEDFVYVDRFRLRRKLDAFEEYVTTGTPETREVAMSYILSTVFEANELLNQDHDSYATRMEKSYERISQEDGDGRGLGSGSGELSD